MNKITSTLLALLALGGCAKDAYCNEQRPEVASSEAYIINGEVSTDLRSVVLVQTSTTNCTGSVIGEHTVLTAAHCLDDDPDFVDIFRGGKFFARGTSYVLHPSYDHKGFGASRKYEGDLALVYFDESLLLLPRVSIAETPTGCYPGLITQGYGRTEDGTFGELRERVVYEVYHNKRTIYTTVGACFGDSGSGLYAETAEGLTLIGIASFARFDCTGSGPRGGSGFTNLYTYGDWITERIQ